MEPTTTEARKRNLNIRLTPGEMAEIRERAARDARAVSEWARLQLLKAVRRRAAKHGDPREGERQ